jgi:Protein of unknown function (DUF3575)
MKQLLIITAIFVTLVSHAQRSNNTVSNTRTHAIKFDATKLIEPEQNISIAYEHRLMQNKISLQLQADYIFDAYTQNSGNSVGFNEKGIRLIPEIRYYSSIKTALTELYFGLQFLNKYAIKNYEEWTLQKDIVGTEYIELKKVRLEKYVFAPHFMLGWHFFLSQDKRLSIDFNMGIGGRTRMVNKSPNNNVKRDFWGLGEDKNISTISFASNLKLCYFFNSK